MANAKSCELYIIPPVCSATSLLCVSLLVNIVTVVYFLYVDLVDVGPHLQ